MRLWPGKRNSDHTEAASGRADSILSAPGPDDAAAGTHPPAWSCAYCQQARPPYVYSADGKAYCVSCAQALKQMGTPIDGQPPDGAATRER